MKFAFVNEYRSRFSVNHLCRVLSASRGGFYKWLRQGSKIKSDERVHQEKKVERVFWKHKRRYGVRRIYRQLKCEAVSISKSTIKAIMHEKNLIAKGRKRFKRTTISNGSRPKAENILDRKFYPEVRGVAWSSDITYLPKANGGFYYLAVVLELCSREFLGWAVGSTMEASLICEAFLSAVIKSPEIKPGIIFHSDQGSQYDSKDFNSLLDTYSSIPSMSRRGNCWDNSPAESFFDTSKTELPECLSFSSLSQASLELFKYIDIYYNRQRMHSTIDYGFPHCYKSSIREEPNLLN